MDLTNQDGGRLSFCPYYATVSDRLRELISLNSGEPMAFKTVNITVDLLNKTATVVAVDQAPLPPPGGPQNLIQATFRFDPPASEGLEKDKAIAAAKVILQQALNEL
jgi:hypothetical protein